MDDGSVYKAKEEIIEYCSAYIDKKFETEKGLIKDYIGLGLKVAVAGIGIAVLTAGFFGWKSYDDVNKSVQAEIKSRFNNENPIVKYENLIKEAAVEGIIAALTARIDGNDLFFSSEDALGFLNRALQDDAISTDRKAAILQFATILPYSANKDEIARSARKLIQVDFKDNRESGIRLMTRLLNLYSSADPRSFVTDALNILDKYKDEEVIAQSVSKMLDKMDPGAASRIISKLGMSVLRGV
jgi:hypothetical protein